LKENEISPTRGFRLALVDLLLCRGKRPLGSWSGGGRCYCALCASSEEREKSLIVSRHTRVAQGRSTLTTDAMHGRRLLLRKRVRKLLSFAGEPLGVYSVGMKNTTDICLIIDKIDSDVASRLVQELAQERSIAIRLKTVRGRQLRQLELMDTSVAIAISVFGGVVAPAIIGFISDLKSRLRRVHHSLGISTRLAEQIGEEVITRYTTPRLKVRLISVQELAGGRGFIDSRII
jgi:hypothetical protein